MVLPYGFYDIIIKKSSLNEEQIKEIVKEYNITNEHIDNSLILIPAGMSDVATQQTIEELINKFNLVYLKNNKAQDFVCVKGHYGLCSQCDWLKFQKIDEEFLKNRPSYFARHKGEFVYEFNN